MNYKSHGAVSSIALAMVGTLYAAKKNAGAAKKDETKPEALAVVAPSATVAVDTPEATTYTEDDIDVDCIADIYRAGTTGTFMAPDVLAPMKQFGHVEVNEGHKDADGRVAVRLSEAGKVWCDENVDFGGGTAEVDTKPTTAAKALPATFEIEEGIVMNDERSSGAGRTGKYPFDLMTAVGQSFHIPATDDTPKPNARYGSAVTSANKRFEEAGKPNRFKIRAVTASDPKGAGARVFRVA